MNIQETIQKINQDKRQAEDDLKQRQSKAKETEIMLEFLSNSFTELVKQLAGGKYNVNFPDTQRIKGEVSVDGLTTLLHSLNELITTTKANKLTLPTTQKVEGEVTVKNQIKIPEVKIPEYPKEISVNNFPQIVEKLDELKKTLSEIEVKPEINVETKASEVSIDLEGVKSGLESIVEEIKRIPKPEKQEFDLSKVENAVDKTTKAIKELVFPVPTTRTDHIATEATVLAILAKLDDLGVSSGTPNYAKKVYTSVDGLIKYICYAEIGSALTSPVWRIKKVDQTGGDFRETWCDGNDLFDNVATDLATVEALTYS